MEQCKRCGSALESWSNFKEMSLRHDIAYAMIGSAGNAFKHMLAGNSFYRKDCDSWSSVLYYCRKCDKYYLTCANCNSLIQTDNMPVNGKALLRCKRCGDRNLYANDFDMSGGA